MTHPKCYSHSCEAPATKSLDFAGRTWPDGRTMYTFACDRDVQKVIDAQGRQDISVTVNDWSPDHARGCVACWRSHGCGLPDDHEGNHVCGAWECDDSPRPDDDVFEPFAFEPVAHTGGVRA